MSLLGTLGSFYMFILILLLVIGFGMAGLWIVNLIFSPQFQNKINNLTAKGNSNANRWLRLAVVSLVGLIITITLMSLINPNGAYTNNSESNTNHSSHQH